MQIMIAIVGIPGNQSEFHGTVLVASKYAPIEVESSDLVVAAA